MIQISILQHLNWLFIGLPHIQAKLGCLVFFFFEKLILFFMGAQLFKFGQFKFQQFKFLKKLKVSQLKNKCLFVKYKKYICRSYYYLKAVFFLLQNIKYFLRYGLNKVKNIVIFNGFTIS